MTETKEKSKKGRMWPIFLIGLLFSSAAANIVMVMLAVNDSSFAVEEHYYKKALNWNKEMAQQKQNALLRWSVGLHTSVGKKHLGATGKYPLLLQVKVLDKQKKPLAPKATVKVISFYSGHASKKYQRTFKRNKAGLFVSAIPFVRSGLWVFRFTIAEGKKQFTQTIERTIKASKSSVKSSVASGS